MLIEDRINASSALRDVGGDLGESRVLTPVGNTVACTPAVPMVFAWVAVEAIYAWAKCCGEQQR